MLTLDEIKERIKKKVANKQELASLAKHVWNGPLRALLKKAAEGFRESNNNNLDVYERLVTTARNVAAYKSYIRSADESQGLDDSWAADVLKAHCRSRSQKLRHAVPRDFKAIILDRRARLKERLLAGEDVLGE